jgi:hypothetical protein
MKRNIFDVTYEIITQESAEHGDAEECGYISEAVTLREAFKSVNDTRTCRVDGVQTIEANEHQVVSPRWLTVYNGMEYETGAHENRSIHFPESCTPSTRRRIASLLGVSV